jgi:hypothetical protein
LWTGGKLVKILRLGKLINAPFFAGFVALQARIEYKIRRSVIVAKGDNT